MAPRILVVDDDESFRALAQGLLQGAGYEVGLACDGVEAVQEVLLAAPALLLLDLRMPVMDGYQVIAELQRLGFLSRIALPVLTEDHEAGERVQGEVGDIAYLPKPFEEEVLLARIAELIGPVGKPKPRPRQ